jgi:hypothetical protein
MRSKIAATVLALFLLVAASQYSPGSMASLASQADSRTFPETGHTVKGRFLKYWDEHGGLAQQGYPISEEMQEQSEVDGKTYTVQYFERAVFELHKQKYEGNTGAPSQTPSSAPDTVKFPETGKSVGGKFLAYWKGHGGLAQQGLPISDEFQEKSDLDGKTYTVQYFERAVFELHPENAGTAYEVLLSQLGTFRYKTQYLTPTAKATPSNTPVPADPAATATTTGNEGFPRVEVPFKYGKLSIEDKYSQLDVQMIDPATYGAALEKEAEHAKKTGWPNDMHLEILPFGTTLKDASSDYNGSEVFDFPIRYKPREDVYIYMAYFNSSGTAYLQVSEEDWDTATNKDKNTEYGELAKDYTSAQIGTNILVAYGKDGDPRGTVGKDIADKIMGYKDASGQKHFEQTPLKVTRKAPK